MNSNSVDFTIRIFPKEDKVSISSNMVQTSEKFYNFDYKTETLLDAVKDYYERWLGIIK